jgi:hypothetical protein
MEDYDNFHSIITKQFDAGINDILTSFKSFSNVEHNPTKGGCREDIIRNFIKKVLPPWADVGHGIIVDRSGKQSPQMDIVIYDKTMLPILFREGVAASFFPIDSVIYVIEIKSVLTTAEITDSLEKYKKLNELDRKVDCSINTVLLGYTTDLKIKNELVRYAENDLYYGTSPLVEIIASVSKGEYFYFKDIPGNDFPNVRIKRWSGLVNETEIYVLKLLFSGIMNTLFKLHIGEYILRGGHIPLYTQRYYYKGVELYKEENLENGNLQAHKFVIDTSSEKLYVTGDF